MLRSMPGRVGACLMILHPRDGHSHRGPWGSHAAFGTLVLIRLLKENKSIRGQRMVLRSNPW